MTCYGCPIVGQQKFFCVKQLQLSNRITSGNPRLRRPGNLKAKIGDNQILFCPTLKYYFHDFQRNFKIDCIFNNLTLICFKSVGFLKYGQGVESLGSLAYHFIGHQRFLQPCCLQPRLVRCIRRDYNS